MKRQYRKGFYVNYKSSNQNSNKALTKVFAEPEKQIQTQEKSILNSGKTTDFVPQISIQHKAPKISYVKRLRQENEVIFHRAGKEIKSSVQLQAAKIIDPEAGIVAKTLSLFWIVLLAILILYIAVILFGSESLLPLGHVIGIIFAALLLLWLLRVL